MMEVINTVSFRAVIALLQMFISSTNTTKQIPFSVIILSILE